MRLVFSSLLAAGLLSSQIASAACPSPADREALDVAGLKTNLMVVTLTCHTDTQYNAFINKFKPDLVQSESSAKGYFMRQNGRAGQKMLDEYMTQLANSKSDASQSDGSRFCAHNDEVFSEVMALKNGEELRQYAAGREVPTPIALTGCDVMSGPATHATRARRRTTHH